MKLTSFNGGLHTQLAPHLIELNEGVQYQNLDNSKGHFIPYPGKLPDVAFTGVLDYGYHFDIEDESYFTDTPQDWVVFQERLYNADRVGVPQKRVANHSFQNLGIVGPTVSPTLVGIGTAVEGVVTYAMTYYNSVDGSESMPIYSAEFSRYDGGINISNLEVSTDPQVDQKRIYRIGGDLTAFTRVDTIDNVDTAYTDTKTDLEVEGSLLQSDTYGQAPAGLKYLTEAYAMLFGILGDKLYYTPIGLPNAWPPLFFIDLPNNGTGIAVSPIGLLVFTEHKTILVTGTGPSLLAQQTLTEDQGCLTHDSIGSIAGQSFWASHDGVCQSDGGIPQVITKQKLGKLDFSGQITNALVWDETYYLHLEDRIFVWDFVYGIPEYQNHDTTSLMLANDILYGLDEATAYALFTDSSSPLIASFKSGWLGQGGLIADKLQDDYKIAFIGTIVMTIWVNGAVVKTITYESDVFAVEKSKLPTDASRNNYIEIALAGTGQVFEINFDEVSANA